MTPPDRERKTSRDNQTIERRSALKAMLASATAPLLSSVTSGQDDRPASRPESRKEAGDALMPVIFLAHGSPYLLDDAAWIGELAAWAKALPPPKAILMISAHWESAPLTIGATRTVPLVYDFYGFPEKYYKVRYWAPGAPELANRVRQLVGHKRVAWSPDRGLDHGAYVPLVAMVPKADVPVLQISLPTMDAPALFALGRKLAPLRNEGVLIVGSGFLTHNLRRMTPCGAEPPSWSKDFDAWAADVLARRAVDELVDYRRRAPSVRDALPTHEHFVPVVVAQGAAADAPGAVSFPIVGFSGGLTRRSVQFG
jgi:4,5-DOPA dioxygenase extradiol